MTTHTMTEWISSRLKEIRSRMMTTAMIANRIEKKMNIRRKGSSPRRASSSAFWVVEGGEGEVR